MISLEFQPSEHLRPFIELYWYWAAEAGDNLSPGRIVPDGLTELVFHIAEPLSLRWAGESVTRQQRSIVVLQTRRYIDLIPQATVGLISVRFRPWAAHAFVRTPLHPFADQVVEAQEIWGNSIDQLENDLMDTSIISDRIKLVEGFLTGQLVIESEPSLETLIRAIWANKYNGRVTALCNDLGVTERQLQRVCAHYLGMPPKQLIRVSRLLRACRIIRSEGWQSLTGVALNCGYYDQAHLNYDFRSLAGMTPTAFHLDRSVSFFEID
jgi:AraC-like DNA-binding protein